MTTKKTRGGAPVKEIANGGGGKGEELAASAGADAELFDFGAISDEELFAGLDEQAGDFDGFWHPEVGHGIRGRLLERRDMPYRGDMRGFYLVELETPARVYNTEDPNGGGKMVTAGKTVAVWEHYRLQELSQISALRPLCAIRYEGTEQTKSGNTVHKMKVGLSRDASVKLQELKEAKRAEEKAKLEAPAPAVAAGLLANTGMDPQLVALAAQALAAKQAAPGS